MSFRGRGSATGAKQVQIWGWSERVYYGEKPPLIPNSCLFSAETMLSSLCISILITSVIATPLSTPYDIPRQRSPLALAPFHTLQAEHQDKVLNNSYIVMLKDDLHNSAMDNHFNFLQGAHEEDPLLADGPVGISQVYNGHLKGYAGRFTDAVIQRIREMPEVAYVEQDSIVYALDTQRFAPWVNSSVPVSSRDW